MLTAIHPWASAQDVKGHTLSAHLWAVPVISPICARHQDWAKRIELLQWREKQALWGGVLDKYASSLSPWGLALPFTHDHSTANSTGTSPWGAGRWITTVRRGFFFLWYFGSLKKLSVVPRSPERMGCFYSWNPMWGQFQWLLLNSQL